MGYILKVGDVEIKLRSCTPSDTVFVYELMHHHLENYFSQIPEGWSRTKFKEKYNPQRITVLEHEDMSIGFYDFEPMSNYLYLHNLQLSSDYQHKGIGTAVIFNSQRTAQEEGISCLKGKVFKDNHQALHWLSNCGFELKSEIPEEKSWWVELWAC